MRLLVSERPFCDIAERKEAAGSASGVQFCEISREYIPRMEKHKRESGFSAER